MRRSGRDPKPQDPGSGLRGLRGSCPSGFRAGDSCSSSGEAKDRQGIGSPVHSALRYPRPDDPASGAAPSSGGDSSRRVGWVWAAPSGSCPGAARRLSHPAAPVHRALPLGAAGLNWGSEGRDRARHAAASRELGSGETRASPPARPGPGDPREPPPCVQRASGRPLLPLVLRRRNLSIILPPRL
ncbi:PREDICTED: nuclear factor of activated T-cells, cytoplasmic 4-like [Cercocebus atys]|uniref:nuclear factor of activated T-cells, cytoplasmic 4-like n=1 Tax=Cercocebus atys TaxID=9531 RepID=UPI0005F3F8B1|nr:PREDICTED: nuclear factor of activated T-cells, cytoplasmic 4-like [Cercocebus atys]